MVFFHHSFYILTTATSTICKCLQILLYVTNHFVEVRIWKPHTLRLGVVTTHLDVSDLLFPVYCGSTFYGGNDMLLVDKCWDSRSLWMPLAPKHSLSTLCAKWCVKVQGKVPLPLPLLIPIAVWAISGELTSPAYNTFPGHGQHLARSQASILFLQL